MELSSRKKHHYRYNMNYKTIKVSNLVNEMLILLEKKSNRKPDDYVEDLIQSQYKNLK